MKQKTFWPKHRILYLCGAIFSKKTKLKMKKLNVFVLATMVGCFNMYADVTPLDFKGPTGKPSTTGAGAHKSPLRFEMPSASYDSDFSSIKFEYNDCLKGAKYNIKNTDDDIVLSGTLTFNEPNDAEIYTNSLRSGGYSVEVVIGEYVVVAKFMVR